MPGADDLMMRIYAAMAQKEREPISECTRVALDAAKARGSVLGGDRGYPPKAVPAATTAAQARRDIVELVTNGLLLEVEQVRTASVTSQSAIARAVNKKGVPVPSGHGAWTHTTVARVISKTGQRAKNTSQGQV